MNRIKEPKALEVIVEKSKPSKQNKRARKFIKALNVFGYLDKKAILQIMPFMFFLTGLAVLYIANSYIAERTIRDIDKTNKEIKEMRAEYISAKTELMVKSKQTEVAASLAPYGIKESTVAPKKIVVHSSK